MDQHIRKMKSYYIYNECLSLFEIEEERKFIITTCGFIKRNEGLVDKKRLY
jgi:hypothetical protein